jgi:hypothetical protein
MCDVQAGGNPAHQSRLREKTASQPIPWTSVTVRAAATPVPDMVSMTVAGVRTGARHQHCAAAVKN